MLARDRFESLGSGEQLDGGESKKNETIAELTYWYRCDVGAMPAGRQLGLLANLPRIQAQARIYDGGIDDEDFEGVYALWMAAYGDEELARKQQTDAAWRIVRQEQTPQSANVTYN